MLITLPPLPEITVSPAIETATPAPTETTGLARLLPAELAGAPLERTGGAGAFPAGGDMCLLFCPGEMQHVAELADIDPDQLRWAAAHGQTAPYEYVIMRAIRVPGADIDLVDAWLESLSGFPRYPFERTIDGRDVTLLVDPAPYASEPVLFVVVRDDVLFSVSLIAPQSDEPTEPDPDAAPRDVILEALASLPE